MTHGLCWRCEYRATFHDIGFGPRYECSRVEMAVHSCYMYRPTKGLLLAPDKGDRRPHPGPAFIAARAHAVGVAEGEYVARKGRGGVAVYFVPESGCACGGDCACGGRAPATDGNGSDRDGGTVAAGVGR